MADATQAADEFDQRWRFRIGTFSPSFWSAVVGLQLNRIEEGITAHRERRPHPERGGPFDGFGASLTHHLGPLDADCFFLLLAIDRVAVLGRLYARTTPSAAVDDAIAAFEREALDVKDLRDVLTHLDAYALGEGRRDDFEAAGVWWPNARIDLERNEVDLRIGNLQIELKRAGRAAAELARALNDAAAAS